MFPLNKICSITVLLLGCSPSPVDTRSNTKNSELAIKAGGAFDSVRLKHLPRTCLSARVEEVGASSEDFFLEKVDSSKDVAHRVGFQADGAFTYGLAKGNAKARLLSEAQSSERSVGFVAYKRVVSRVARAMEPNLLSGYSYPDCGDKYVSSVSYGTEMMAMVKLIFSTSKFKKTFEGSAGGSYGSVGNIKATVDTLDQQTKRDSYIVIRVHADGDDLNITRRLMNGEETVYCSLSAFDKCAQLLADIINYQNGEMRQAAARSNTVIGHELDDYPSIPEPNDFGVKSKLRLLDDALKQSSIDFDRALTLESFSILNQEEKNEVMHMRSIIDKNMQVLQVNIRSCLNNPQRCDPNANLQAYDRQPLELRTKEYTVTFYVEENGVKGCQERAEEKAHNRCQEEASKLPGDLMESRVELGQPDHWRESNDLEITMRGNRCRSKISDSRCVMKIRF